MYVDINLQLARACPVHSWSVASAAQPVHPWPVHAEGEVHQ